jgi:hypothetical protein
VIGGRRSRGARAWRGGVAGLVAVVAACGGAADARDGADAGPAADAGAQVELEQAVATARADYPTAFDLQTRLVSMTCSPNPGVCHQTNNYPDMTTIGNLLGAIGAPCNLEIPEPTEGWDACERPADQLEIDGEILDIAWREPIAPGSWRVVLAGPAAADLVAADVRLLDADGELLLDVDEDLGALTATLTTGSPEVELAIASDDPVITELVDGVMATVRGGDPNRNGVWGATDPGVATAALVFPGDLERSYLWGRITGTVPGTRMPLANGPVSNPQYVALACWIEGLAGAGNAAYDPIDYDACEFAREPVDHAIEDF